MAKMDNFREDRKTPGAGDSSMPAADSVHRWRRWPYGRSGAGQFVVNRRVRGVRSLSCGESEKFGQQTGRKVTRLECEFTCSCAGLLCKQVSYQTLPKVLCRLCRLFNADFSLELRLASRNFLQEIDPREMLARCLPNRSVYNRIYSRTHNWIAYCLLRSAYRPLTSRHELGSLIR